jgi:hypothetical protein
VLQLKSSLRSFLDWAVTFVPNFSSSNLVDVNFLDFRPQYTFVLYEGFASYSNKLLFIKKMILTYSNEPF